MSPTTAKRSRRVPTVNPNPAKCWEACDKTGKGRKSFDFQSRHDAKTYADGIGGFVRPVTPETLRRREQNPNP